MIYTVEALSSISAHTPPHIGTMARRKIRTITIVYFRCDLHLVMKNKNELMRCDEFETFKNNKRILRINTLFSNRETRVSQGPARGPRASPSKQWSPQNAKLKFIFLHHTRTLCVRTWTAKEALERSTPTSTRQPAMCCDASSYRRQCLDESNVQPLSDIVKP